MQTLYTATLRNEAIIQRAKLELKMRYPGRVEWMTLDGEALLHSIAIGQNVVLGCEPPADVTVFGLRYSLGGVAVVPGCYVVFDFERHPPLAVTRVEDNGLVVREAKPISVRVALLVAAS